MAKCDLEIELESADARFLGGELVRGRVIVRADSDVHCRNLSVSAGWFTRGRGNIARETGTPVSVFSGAVEAGQTRSFDFEVACLPWPPTGDGHYLSVEHFVEATADIPWAFDPVVTVPIHVSLAEVTLDQITLPSPPTVLGGMALVVILISAIVASAFATIAMTGFGFWVVLVLSGVIGGSMAAIGIAFYLLPWLVLGHVEVQWGQTKLAPGERICGTLSFTPRQSQRIEGIDLKLSASERCVSGSGSNRKIHQHVAFEEVIQALASTELQPGQSQRIELVGHIPTIDLYSMKLGDNELLWQAEARISLSGMPNWREKVPLTVVPGSALGRAIDRHGEAIESISTAGADVNAARDVADGGISFGETVEQFWNVKDDLALSTRLADAVVELPMEVDAVIDRRLLYTPPDEPKAYPDGHVVLAHYDDPPLPLTLHIPGHLAGAVEDLSGQNWRTMGEVMGWDAKGQRLRIRVTDA